MRLSLRLLSLGSLISVALAACTSRGEDAALPESTEASGAADAPATEERTRPAPLRWTSMELLIRTRFPGVPQLSTEELAQRLANEGGERPLLLDVRAAEEFEVSHLAGAELATDEAMALERLADSPKDRPVVVYCSVGYRSSELATKLRKRGYTNVENLDGSIFAWANEGREVVDADGTAERVHPFDGDWGELLHADLRAELE